MILLHDTLFIRVCSIVNEAYIKYILSKKCGMRYHYQTKAALTEVAQRPAISRFTLADIRGDTSTVAAILGTDWNATVSVRGLRIAFAAFLYGFLFHQFLQEAGVINITNDVHRHSSDIFHRQLFSLLWPKFLFIIKTLIAKKSNKKVKSFSFFLFESDLVKI